MLPHDAIKAPQDKKTLELCQSRPAKRKQHREAAHDQDCGTPHTHLNLEGMPTLARSRRGKGTVLTGVGPSPMPKGENLLVQSWASPGKPISRERDLSGRKRKILILFSEGLS